MTKSSILDVGFFSKFLLIVEKVPKIKFSHRYEKMPLGVEKMTTWLVGVSLCNVNELPKSFLEYDTKYFEHDDSLYKPKANESRVKIAEKFYELPKGKVLVLSLFSKDYNRHDTRFVLYDFLWTTIRRWTPQKEKYYKGLIGKQVNIVIS